MSLFDSIFFILLYSFQYICIGGLRLIQDQPNVERDNYMGRVHSQSNPFRMTWQAPNQTIHNSHFEGISDVHALKEGWSNVENWPKSTFRLGQVSGVSVDTKGIVYIFHRGDRQWGAETFDDLNRIRDGERRRGPISVPTVILYHPVSGEIVQKWGENMFYMPHGITVDKDNNVWMTDVALHQVFKYPTLKTGSASAELTLGEAFVPGTDAAHFCKPTSIAVTSWGDFFVADGYCNSRILKFNKNGVKISEWGRSNINHGIGQSANYMFSVPHALTLADDKGLVCAADRENGRIQCFDWHNGTFISKLHSPVIGSRLFSVAYAPINGGLFFVVNGVEFKQFAVPVGGFVLNGDSKDVFQFGVNKLQNPHDIAVSPDGKTIYVVEIDPFRIWKFISNDNFNAFVEVTNTTLTKVVAESKEEAVKVLLPTDDSSSTAVSASGILPAVLVTSAALLFAGALLTAALIYSKAKRRGRTLEEQNYYMETKKLVTSEY